MSIIKFTDKGFLYEHPFKITDTPQTHSYIFSGDEIVLGHGITLPDDASAADISNIKLVSAKVSIIAQKPGIFTEEFSRQFNATRSFELDSFTLAINQNTNARSVPWLPDNKYAPNLNFQQDRIFKLVAGDFRRQINFFTERVGTSDSWKYWFYFPILFRWEYWLSRLAPAFSDDDFWVNDPTIQYGQNNFWLRYFIANKWLIKSRLELNILINGVPQIIRNDLNLTPNSDDVNDYSSNSDWINKVVKTSKIGGAEQATCPIYNTENTQVLAHLEKVSGWGGTEQGDLRAVVWIEPFEGGGITQRRRVGSSCYPITAEDVGIGLGTSITDDSGTHIITAGGDYIVTDVNGNGATIIFNALHPEKILIYAQIDYNKLAAFYPGVDKFTIYARLYNDSEGVILSQYGTVEVISSGGLDICALQGYRYTSSGGRDNIFYFSGRVSHIHIGDEYEVVFPLSWNVTVLSPVLGLTYILLSPNHYKLTRIADPQCVMDWKVVVPAGKADYIVYFGISGSALVDFPQGIDYPDGNTKKGEEIKHDAPLLKESSSSLCGATICPTIERGCPFDLDVFSDHTDPLNDLKNDKSDFYYSDTNTIAAIALTLQKNDSNCADGNWIDKATFSNSNYGKFFAYGKSNDFTGVDFVDDYGRKYTGLFLEWLKIYNAFGNGVYRMKIVRTDIDNNSITCYDQRIFCLKTWNCNLADKSVRLETINKGLRGDRDNPYIFIDYQAGWNGQIRLRGIIYDDKPTYVNEFTEFGDSQSNRDEDYIAELHPKMKIDFKPVPGWIDRYLENYFLLANQKFVTDYNSVNINVFDKTPVYNDGGIESKRETLAPTERLAAITISCRYALNNLRARNSQ